MTHKWTEGDPVIVEKLGVEIEGFVNIINKKNGMIHVHTDRGPITLLAKSLAIRLNKPVEEEPEKDEKASKV